MPRENFHQRVGYGKPRNGGKGRNKPLLVEQGVRFYNPKGRNEKTMKSVEYELFAAY